MALALAVVLGAAVVAAVVGGRLFVPVPTTTASPPPSNPVASPAVRPSATPVLRASKPPRPAGATLLLMGNPMSAGQNYTTLSFEPAFTIAGADGWQVPLPAPGAGRVEGPGHAYFFGRQPSGDPFLIPALPAIHGARHVRTRNGPPIRAWPGSANRNGRTIPPEQSPGRRRHRRRPGPSSPAVTSRGHRPPGHLRPANNGPPSCPATPTPAGFPIRLLLRLRHPARLKQPPRGPLRRRHHRRRSRRPLSLRPRAPRRPIPTSQARPRRPIPRRRRPRSTNRSHAAATCRPTANRSAPPRANHPQVHRVPPAAPRPIRRRPHGPARES